MNASESPRIPSGTVLRDYEIQDILGTGGFGITYLATHIHLHNKVAIKEYMPQEFSRRADDLSITPYSQPKHREFFNYGLDRFLNEARDLVRFSHPNIIGASNYFEANGTAYIVMEYAQGYTFEKWLTSLRHPPDEEELKEIFLPLLDGLREVHKHDLLHRDIKPENIYLQENGPPLLIDFGAARNALGTRSRSLGVVISHGYSPKEQYASAGNQGAWTDVYSVGACIRRAISGQIPPESTIRADDMDNGEADPLQPAATLFAGQYSEPFLATVDWCMALSSRDRPQTVMEVQDCLLGLSAPPNVKPTRHQRAYREEVDKGRKKRPDPEKVPTKRNAEPDSSQQRRAGRAERISRNSGPTESRGRYVIPALLGLLVIGGLLGMVYFLQLSQTSSSGERTQVAIDESEIQQRTAEAVRAEFAAQLEMARDNAKQIDRLDIVVSAAEMQSLRSEVESAERLAENNDEQSALAKVSQVLDQQSTILSAYPRRFRTGSSRESKAKAYDLCVQSIGELNCAKAWFDSESQSRVSLSPFSLDSHEVTFEQFATFANRQGYSSSAEERGWSLQQMSNLDVSTLSGFNWRQPEGAEGASYQQFLDHPVVHVSHRDAREYCSSKGARLPTRAEWEYAMSQGGPDEFASYFDSSSMGRLVDMPKINSLPAMVDALLDSRTRIFGGTGNVWEWTDTPDPGGGSRRLLKGGSWNETTPAFMRFAALRPEFQGDTFIDVGFRCAADLDRWPESTRG